MFTTHATPILAASLAVAAVMLYAMLSITPPASAAAGGAARPAASAAAPVEYAIYLNHPQTQTADIEVTFPGITGTTLDVALPVWRPGRYAVLDPAGTIRTVSARLADGRDVPIVKTDKSTWRISLPPRESGDSPAHRVTVRYTLYANSLADRTRHIDDTHAFLSGAAVFMYAPELRSRPVRVAVHAPEGWRTATGLEADPAAPGVFLAANYDVLVDSPLEIGLHDVVRFDVDGVPHEIAAWPPGELRHDHGTIAAEFGAIVRTQRAIFGDLPYSRYVFILHIGAEASGGTEHLNSFVAQTSRAAFDPGEARRYRGFLGLISHEMFHTWNVKQMRPADLNPYDYTRENYTTLLWLVEGTTSYYDDLCLVRADGPDGKPLMKPDDYLGLLAGAISAERSRPGLHVQSLADSSFDAWIKFNRPTPDAVNSTVSFYSKGALVSLLLDMEIRARTGNRASYDDVLRTLYQRFPLSGPGYTAADVVEVLNEVTGSDMSGFLDQYVGRPGDLPLEAALGTVGLELAFEPAEREETDAGDVETGEQPQKAWLGITLEDRGGRAVVSTVYADGPGAAAGIIPGDEVLALDGLRLRVSELETRLKSLKPGTEVAVTLFRRDRLRTIPLTVGGKPDGKWTLKRRRDATAEQKAAYESWLGRAWEE